MHPLPDDVLVRPMRSSDVTRVLKIIRKHDDDDYLAARKTYRRSLEGQFVVEVQSRVAGVTGARPVEETDRTWTVSWTYLRPQVSGRGLGRFMLDQLIEYLKANNCRKVFVNTSDYFDPDRGDIYRDAREAYQAVGFQEELRHADYYAPGETMLTYGMSLQANRPEPHELALGNIFPTFISSIDETEDAYWIAWELNDRELDYFEYERYTDLVRGRNGRVAFMGFPTDVANVEETMTRAKFRRDGVLKDYFEDGVDQVHYRMDFL